MKRIISMLLAFCVVLTSTGIAAAEPKAEQIELLGAGAILIDASTGEVLYSKNADKTYYPASMTKILTCILALENLDLDDVLTIDAETPFTEGSRIYLEEGENITVRELMYGMMLESANDAAVAFAKAISGSVEEFAELMNKKAKECGAKNSNFVNPNGLHEEEHVSTAYDMAMIARYAMKNEVFRRYVSTYKHDIPETNKQEIRHLYNTNRLLYDNQHKVTVNGEERGCKYKGVTGIKTGYTSHAQGCLAAGAKRNGTELIAVVMASTDMGRFQDCITLLDYGFENYKTADVLEARADMGSVRVKHGAVNRVTAVAGEDVCVTLTADASENLIKTEIKLDKSVKAPVKKGQKIGTLIVTAGGKELRTADLVAKDAVAKGGILSVVGISDRAAKWIRNIILSLLALFILVLTVYILIKRRQVKKRKMERARRKEEARRREMEQKARWEEEYWKSRM